MEEIENYKKFHENGKIFFFFLGNTSLHHFSKEFHTEEEIFEYMHIYSYIMKKKRNIANVKKKFLKVLFLKIDK